MEFISLFILVAAGFMNPRIVNSQEEDLIIDPYQGPCEVGIYYAAEGQCIDINADFYDVLGDRDHQIKRCKDHGATFVSITTAEKQEFLKAHINTSLLTGDVSFWIGLRLDESTNVWMWENGESLDNTTFYLDAKSNAKLKTGMHCVAMDSSEDLMWKPMSCTGEGHGRICEKSVCENNGGCPQACSFNETDTFCHCYPGYRWVNSKTCEEIDLCGKDGGGCKDQKCVTVNGTKKECLCPDGEDCSGKGKDKDDGGMDGYVIPLIIGGALVLTCCILVVALGCRKSSRGASGSSRSSGKRKKGAQIEKEPSVLGLELKDSSPPPTLVTPVYDPIMGSPV